MKFHSQIIRSFMLTCKSQTFGICAVVGWPLVPCLTATAWGHHVNCKLPLTSLWYCQCWFFIFYHFSPLPTTTFWCLPATCFRPILLFFVNILSLYCFLSSLGAIFVAIKYKAVVLLEIIEFSVFVHLSTRLLQFKFQSKANINASFLRSVSHTATGYV